jgi:copper chaperone CopZ
MKTLRFISVIILSFLLLFHISCGQQGNKELKPVSSDADANVEVLISGMTCTGCEQTIQTNVSKLEGVKSVKATFTDGRALVDYNPTLTDTSLIRKAITESGYKVVGFNSVPQSDPSK